MNPYHNLYKLVHDILLQACRDALKGDAEAIAWLEDAGAFLAWRIGLVSDPEQVRAWAQQPTPPTGLNIQQVKELSGFSHGVIQVAIYNDELPAYPSLTGIGTHYLIPPAEAHAWLRRRKSQGEPHV